MMIKKAEVAEKLESVINRLEDLISEGSVIQETDDIDYEGDGIEMEGESPDEIGGAESALLMMERQLNAVIQVVGEEVENLRRILEGIEDLR